MSRKFAVIMLLIFAILPLAVKAAPKAAPMDDLGILIDVKATEGNTLGAVVDMTFDDNNNLYIVDNQGNIEVYDSNYNFVRRGVSTDSNQPRGIAVAPNGNIYLASLASAQVNVLDRDFNTLHSLDTPSAAMSLALSSDGILYVLLIDNLVAFDTNNNDAPVALTPGISIDRGRAITLDNKGNLIVSDNNGVHFLDSSLNQVSRIDRSIGPLDVDSAGNLYALGAYANAAQLIVYNPNREIIGDTQNVGARTYVALALNGNTAYVFDFVNQLVFGYEMFAPAKLNVVFNPANGNYYSAVNGQFTWSQANEAANSSRYEGCAGYLATVTSQAETDFLVAQGWGERYWLGGYQADTSNEPAGGWAWVTGEPWEYTNWAPGEPNNNNFGQPENHLQMAFNFSGNFQGRDLNIVNQPGTWNDNIDSASPDAFQALNGYIVEFDCQASQ